MRLLELTLNIGAEEVTKALASAAGEDEQSVGLTFPGVYAMIAKLYLKINVLVYGYQNHLKFIFIYYNFNFNF